MSIIDRIIGKKASAPSAATESLIAEANRLRDARQFAEAAEAYERYLAQKSDDFDIWVQRGNCLKDSGSLVAAKMAYDQALRLKADDDDVYVQLGHLMKLSNKKKEAIAFFRDAININKENYNAASELRILGFKTKPQKSPLMSDRFASKSAKLIDISDLLIYIRIYSRVTGIQRVQSCIVSELIKHYHRDNDFNVGDFLFCYCDQYNQKFYGVSASIITELLDAVEAAEGDRSGIDEALSVIDRSRVSIDPRPGDSYTILGAFWIGEDYTGSLLKLKRSGVHVGAYIYDLIPITHSQFVVESSRQATVDKFADVMLLADFALTISEFVAKEVRYVTQSELGREIPVLSVPLAHELPLPSIADDTEELDEEFLSNIPNEYVLCVCTLEGRKNHMLLLNTWQSLNKKYNGKIPKLLLVGKWGWKIEEFASELAASRNVDGKIIVLGNLSDRELEYVYKGCLFTVFPSFVEGWGLPVGESLAYGKPCIASNTSSIPEVGGDFCRYINPHDSIGALELIEKTLFDRDGLEAWTKRVAQDFKIRTWADVAENFSTRLDQLLAVIPKKSPEPIKLTSGEVLHIGSDANSSGSFSGWRSRSVKFVCSENWRQIEPWGCWSSKAKASISFGSDLVEGSIARVLVQLRLPAPAERDTVAITTSIGDRTVSFADGRPRWVSIDVEVGVEGRISFDLNRSSNIEQIDPNRPIFHGISAICYHEKNDIAARLDLLESIVVFGN